MASVQQVEEVEGTERSVMVRGAVRTRGPQNKGMYDLWSHGQRGHAAAAAGEPADQEAEVGSVVCNWDKPKE